MPLITPKSSVSRDDYYESIGIPPYRGKTILCDVCKRTYQRKEIFLSYINVKVLKDPARMLQLSDEQQRELTWFAQNDPERPVAGLFLIFCTWPEFDRGPVLAKTAVCSACILAHATAIREILNGSK